MFVLTLKNGSELKYNTFKHFYWGIHNEVGVFPLYLVDDHDPINRITHFQQIEQSEISDYGKVVIFNQSKKGAIEKTDEKNFNN